MNLMEEGLNPSRRHFLQASILVPAMAAPLFRSDNIFAQEGQGASEEEESFTVDGIIGSNHGHAAELEIDPLAIPETGIELSIQGKSGHDHTLTLSLSDLQAIAAGHALNLTSSRDAGHTHVVDFQRLGLIGNISANHGHFMFLPANWLDDAAIKTVQIQGDSSHPHTVELSAANLDALLDGKTVTVESSRNFGHAHTVVLTPPKT